MRIMKSTKQRSETESLIDVRRSSRIVSKRKTEEDEFEVQKKVRKRDTCKQDGLFSIFDNRKSEAKPQPGNRRGRPRKQSRTPVHSKEASGCSETEPNTTTAKEGGEQNITPVNLPDNTNQKKVSKDESNKRDSYFSIFDKGKSEPKPQSGKQPSTPEQNVEQEVRTVRAKRTGKTVESKTPSAGCKSRSAKIVKTEVNENSIVDLVQEELQNEDTIKRDAYFSIFHNGKSDDKSKPEKHSCRSKRNRMSVDYEEVSESSEDDFKESNLTKIKDRNENSKTCADDTQKDNLKGDGYFGIFNKEKSEPQKRRGRPPKGNGTPVRCKESSSNKCTEFNSTKVNRHKKNTNVCVELVDVENSPPENDVKSVPEFIFVSSFVEQELPLSNLPNHVRQYESEADGVESECVMKLANVSADERVEISGKHSMRDVNGYFSVCDAEQHDGDVSEGDTVSDDHRMWVDRYKPKCLRDIAGHVAEVELLANWLSEWKQKLKPSVNNSESSNSGLSFDMSDDEGGLLKCVTLSGRCGTGKTSTVYAVARELGFKVFEVNLSSSRVGRHLLHQLQEATLSHHVQGIPKTSPFFKDFVKIDKNLSSEDNSQTPPTSKTVTMCNTKAAKTKRGPITKYFKKTDSPSGIRELQSPKTEAKCLKKSPLLNYFKPRTKNDLYKADEEKSPDTTADISIVSDVPAVSSKPCSSENSSVDVIVDVEKETCENALDNDVMVIDEISGQPNDILKCKLDMKNCTSNVRVDTELTKSIDVTSRKRRTSKAEKAKANENVGVTGDVSAVLDPSGQGSPEQLAHSKENDEVDGSPEISKLKFCSLSVILFDDADIGLDVDEGFLSAINSFLKITRKPVVLTSSENTEELCHSINSDLCLINLDRQESSALRHLKAINEKEQLGLQENDIELLLKHCKLDIRQCVLQLQFWGEIGRRDWKYGHIFNLPLPVLCLSSYLSKNIVRWIFDWNDLQASAIVFSCFSYDINILHSNMCLWLPFKRELRKTESENTKKPVKKYRRLDVSWLSDEGSDNDDSMSPTETPLERNGTKESPDLLQSLMCMSQLYNSYSEADAILKSGCEFGDSLWCRQKPPFTKQPYNNNSAMEMATWVTLLSSRKCRNELENLASDDIRIFAEDDSILNIESQASGEKLVRSRQNIANGVLSSQRLNHRARCVDYLSLLRTVHKCEEVRKECNTKRSRRFLHYFEASGFTVDKTDLLSITNAFL